MFSLVCLGDRERGILLLFFVCILFIRSITAGYRPTAWRKGVYIMNEFWVAVAVMVVG
jgi:hypothetical protein